MVHVQAASLQDILLCQGQPLWPEIVDINFFYPCTGSLILRSLNLLKNIHVLWKQILRLRGPEMYLLGCICTTISWFVVAVASIHSCTVRRFYASGARVVLLMSTKLVCKVVAIVSLAVWRNAPPSTYCKWYLPVDGAVLLWQAQAAPVGTVMQTCIAAADVAGTFCCCWLLSERLPHSISTGTLLAFSLLLGYASLWLAERLEQSDRRDYEGIRAMGAVITPAGEEASAVVQQDAGVAYTGNPHLHPHGLMPVGTSSGGSSEGRCMDADASYYGPDALNPGGGKCCEGGSSLLTGSVCSRRRSQAKIACAVTATPMAVQSPIPNPQLQQQQQSQDIGESLCDCCSIAPQQFLSPNDSGATANVYTSISCIGARVRMSGGGAGGADSSSEPSFPTTLTTTRSLSRVLPSLSTISNCSALRGAGGGTSRCMETGGFSRGASRPSSYGGPHIAGRTTFHGRPQSALHIVTGGLARGQDLAGDSDTAATDAKTAPSASSTSRSLHHEAAGDALALHGNTAEVDFADAAGLELETDVFGLDANELRSQTAAPQAPTTDQVPAPTQREAVRLSNTNMTSHSGQHTAHSSGLVSNLELSVSVLQMPGSFKAMTDCCTEAREHDDNLPETGCLASPITFMSGRVHDAATVLEVPVACAPVPAPARGAPSDHLRRLMQDLVLRSGGGVGGTTAAARMTTEPAQLHTAHSLPPRNTTSRGTSTSGAASSSWGPVSDSSSECRCLEPRFCSHQSQKSTSAVAVSATGLLIEAQGWGGATPNKMCSGGAVEAQHRGGCEPSGSGGGFHTRGTTQATISEQTVVMSIDDNKSSCPSADPTAISMLLMSSDYVEAHPHEPSVLYDSLLRLQQLRPSLDVRTPALAADELHLQQQCHLRSAAIPATISELSVRSCLPEGGLPGIAVSQSDGKVVPPQTSSLSQAYPGVSRLDMQSGGMADDREGARPATGAHAASFGLSGAASAATAQSLRGPRCFALARSLVMRGGNSSVYEIPALYHTRCSMKLTGLSSADLPCGFAERVASLLAAAGRSVASPTVALASVGVYLRDGCVEVVADVLVPSDAAMAESVAAAVAANARGPDGDRRRPLGAECGSSTGPDALRHVLTMAEASSSTNQQQVPDHASAAPRLDHASAEAMLDLLERTLLPQIQNALPPQRGMAGEWSHVGGHGGGVGLQVTVGAVQVGSWRNPQRATLPPPPPPRQPPPPTIVCVSPCCVPLSQPSGDDTRDRRRQTLSLTLALAGVVNRGNSTATLPRIFVRHSGRCLAAVVRRSELPYMGCLTVHVEVATSGIRPGLLFLEAAMPDSVHSHGRLSALSLPWPVLIVGDARVVLEVMQVQQQLEAAAIHRAFQADSKLLLFHQQGTDSSESQEQLMQHQVDGGVMSLLLDLGMWFEVVSTADAPIIAAVTSGAFGGNGVGTATSTGTTSATGLLQPLLLEQLGTVNGEAQSMRTAQEQDKEKEREGAQHSIDDDDSSWASSDEQSVDEPMHEGMSRRPTHASQALPRGHEGIVSTCIGGLEASDRDGEAQLLLLRGLQPEQELMEGSVDCAVEYEQWCRQSTALQSTAAGLGMRLLRYAVLRGWPAAATLLLKGLIVHSGLDFSDIKLLFPVTAGGSAMPLLHTAVLSGSLTMVRAVKAWAQRYRCVLPWDEADSATGGLTPLHLASVQDGGRLAGSILGLWPDAEALWAAVRDRDGHTPQEYACMRALSGSFGVAPAAAAPGQELAISPSDLPTDAPPSTVGVVAAATTMLSHQPQHQDHEKRTLQQPQPQPQLHGEMLLHPFHPHDWSSGQSLDEDLPSPFLPSGQQQQLKLQDLQTLLPVQGLSQQQQAIASAMVLGPQSAAVNIAAAAAQQQNRMQPQLREAGVCEGSCSGGPIAAVLGEGPGFNCSSLYTGPGAQGASFGASTCYRFDRTSDCGSMSVGPDSQWSYSTNFTTVTQTTYCKQQTTSPLLDTRGGLSPIKAVSACNAFNAAVLSLANLPNVGQASLSTGGASIRGAARAAASRGTADVADCSATGLLSNTDSGPETSIQPQAFLPPENLQKDLTLHRQVPSPQESVGVVFSPFGLEQLEEHNAAASPRLMLSFSPQLRRHMQQQYGNIGNFLKPHMPLASPQLALEQLEPRHSTRALGLEAAREPKGVDHVEAAMVDVADGCTTAARISSIENVSKPRQGRGGIFGPGKVAKVFSISRGHPGGQAWQPWRALAAFKAVTKSPVSAFPSALPCDDKSIVGEVVGDAAQDRTSAPAVGGVGRVGSGGSGGGSMHGAALAAVTTGDVEPNATPTAQSSQSSRSPSAGIPLPGSRGMRLLATRLLADSRRTATSAFSASLPPESSGSQADVSAGAASNCLHLSNTRVSTGVLGKSMLTSHHGGFNAGRFVCSPRRMAFADDYVPACEPTVEARWSCFERVMPLLREKKRLPGVMVKANRQQQRLQGASGRMAESDLEPVLTPAGSEERVATPSCGNSSGVLPGHEMAMEVESAVTAASMGLLVKTEEPIRDVVPEFAPPLHLSNNERPRLKPLAGEQPASSVKAIAEAMAADSALPGSVGEVLEPAPRLLLPLVLMLLGVLVLLVAHVIPIMVGTPGSPTSAGRG